jgi:acyl carrier protein
MDIQYDNDAITKIASHFESIIELLGVEIPNEKIVEILCEQLMLDKDQIQMDTAITDDLGADSLDLVEVLMACEDEFDVEIPDEDAEKFKNVGDLVHYIENNQ